MQNNEHQGVNESESKKITEESEFEDDCKSKSKNSVSIEPGKLELSTSHINSDRMISKQNSKTNMPSVSKRRVSVEKSSFGVNSDLAQTQTSQKKLGNPFIKKDTPFAAGHTDMEFLKQKVGQSNTVKNNVHHLQKKTPRNLIPVRKSKKLSIDTSSTIVRNSKVCQIGSNVQEAKRISTITDICEDEDGDYVDDLVEMVEHKKALKRESMKSIMTYGDSGRSIMTQDGSYEEEEEDTFGKVKPKEPTKDGTIRTNIFKPVEISKYIDNCRYTEILNEKIDQTKTQLRRSLIGKATNKVLQHCRISTFKIKSIEDSKREKPAGRIPMTTRSPHLSKDPYEIAKQLTNQYRISTKNINSIKRRSDYDEPLKKDSQPICSRRSISLTNELNFMRGCTINSEKVILISAEEKEQNTLASSLMERSVYVQPKIGHGGHQSSNSVTDSEQMDVFDVVDNDQIFAKNAKIRFDMRFKTQQSDQNHESSIKGYMTSSNRFVKPLLPIYNDKNELGQSENFGANSDRLLYQGNIRMTLGSLIKTSKDFMQRRNNQRESKKSDIVHESTSKLSNNSTISLSKFVGK